MYRRYLHLLLTLLVLLPALGSARAQAPEALMEQVSERMLERLAQERAQIAEEPPRLFALVDEVLSPHVDYYRMAGWVLGRHWRGADERQRREFMAAFHNLLVRFYTSALIEDPRQLDEALGRRHELITFEPTRTAQGSETAVVRATAHMADGTNVPIRLSVHRRDGDWKVYDVNVEGVSLVSTYRTAFADEIRRDGLDAVIERLQRRNAELLEKAAAANAATD